MCCLSLLFLFIYFFVVVTDISHTLSVEVNTLPGEIKIHMLQYMNINWKYVSFDGEIHVQSCL